MHVTVHGARVSAEEAARLDLWLAGRAQELLSSLDIPGGAGAALIAAVSAQLPGHRPEEVRAEVVSQLRELLAATGGPGL